MATWLTATSACWSSLRCNCARVKSGSVAIQESNSLGCCRRPNLALFPVLARCRSGRLKSSEWPFAGFKFSGTMQKRIILRAYASSVVRKHRWLPPTVVFASASIFAAAVVKGSPPYSILASAGALVLASYIWGYAARACRVTDFPSLLNLPRRQYGDVWDALAATPGRARVAACGHEDETSLSPFSANSS